jgi:peptidoglycan/xylan/chitin deacetylase (PgdA/CDA1 family)
MVRSFRCAVLALALVACSEAPTPPAEGSSGGSNASGGISGQAGSTLSGGAGGSAGQGGGAGQSGSAGQGGTGGSGGAPSSAFFSASPTSWKGGAKGAYTIIHDDLCGSPASLDNGTVSGLLASRGLHAAFGAIVQGCNDNELWPAVSTLSAAGHEVINHSWDHTDHVCAANLAVQIDQAHSGLTSNVGTPTFYIFPFDSSNDAALAHLASLGYLGARGGVKGALNSADYPDDFKLNFDVYGPGYSNYCDLGACATETLTCSKDYNGVACEAGAPDATNQGTDDCRASVLRQYVDDAIAQGGWAIREFHGVDDGWEPVPSSVYGAHLDYVKDKASAGELWVENPTPIIRYRRARQHCTSTVTDHTLSFGSPSAACLKYAVPLSFTLTVNDTDPPALSATQGGSSLTVTKTGPGTFQVELDPTGGDVLVQ